MPDFAEPIMVKYLHDKAAREGIPVSGTFELTQRCNFSCEMCYVHDCTQKTDPLSAEDWLNIAKTNSALNHIKKYLSKQNISLNKDEAIARGKELFTIACRTDGVNLEEALKLLNDEKYKRIRVYPTVDDMYAAIGNRHVSASNISSKIRSELKLKEKLSTTQEILQKTKTRTTNKSIFDLVWNNKSNN